jgi:hypothetical protein
VIACCTSVIAHNTSSKQHSKHAPIVATYTMVCKYTACVYCCNRTGAAQIAYASPLTCGPIVCLKTGYLLRCHCKIILITSPHEACSILQVTCRVLNLFVRASSTVHEASAHCSALLCNDAGVLLAPYSGVTFNALALNSAVRDTQQLLLLQLLNAKRTAATSHNYSAHCAITS